MPHKHAISYLGKSHEKCPKPLCHRLELQLGIGEHDQAQAYLLRQPLAESSRSPYEETVTADRMVIRCGPHSDRRSARITRLGRGSRIDQLSSHKVDLGRWPWGCLRYPTGSRRISLGHHLDRRLPI